MSSTDAGWGLLFRVANPVKPSRIPETIRMPTPESGQHAKKFSWTVARARKTLSDLSGGV